MTTKSIGDEDGMDLRNYLGKVGTISQKRLLFRAYFAMVVCLPMQLSFRSSCALFVIPPQLRRTIIHRPEKHFLVQS